MEIYSQLCHLVDNILSTRNITACRYSAYEKDTLEMGKWNSGKSQFHVPHRVSGYKPCKINPVRYADALHLSNIRCIL